MTFIGQRSEQQSAVYAAQSTIPRWRFFNDVDEIQTWCDTLTSSPWWEKRWPDIVRIEAYKHASSRCSVAHTEEENKCGVIHIAQNMMTANTVLHEIAHCVSPAGAGHTGAWVRSFLELTYLSLGSEEYSMLYNAFSDHGVDVG